VDYDYPLLYWTRVHRSNAGFGVLDVFNASVLRHQRVRVGSEAAGFCFVEDSVYLVKGRGLWFGVGVGAGVGVGLAVLAAALAWTCRKYRAAA
jgi:hypothetical protein